MTNDIINSIVEQQDFVDKNTPIKILTIYLTEFPQLIVVSLLIVFQFRKFLRDKSPLYFPCLFLLFLG